MSRSEEVSKMRRTLVPLALALVVSLPPAAADAVGGVPAPSSLLGVEDAFFTKDPDGGRTLRLLLEDHVGGPYFYTKVDLSNAHETVGSVVGTANRGAGDTIRNTPEPIREGGAFAHPWTYKGSPMVTLGAYVIHQTEGLLRVPLVIVENASSLGDVTTLATSLALNDATDFSLHALPFLLEYALPEYSQYMDTWPAGQISVDTFRDYPRVYAWTVKKATPAGEIWEGAYLERLGSWSGGFTESYDFEGKKSIEVGLAHRANGIATRLAGVYAETHLKKEAGNPQTASQRITVGTVTETTGRVPVAGVELADERGGAYQFSYPEDQRTGIVFGAYVAGRWTPLLGTWTEAHHTVHNSYDIEQTRLTSVGVYVGSDYVPVAGVRYHGDRSTTYAFATRFVNGGTLGADTTGDFELDAGTFVNGQFVPLVGATYADDFADADFHYQTMITVGVHTPLGYQPVLGFTYDGERPFLDWALAWSAGRRADTLDWMVTSGTFLPRVPGVEVGPVGAAKYIPLVGARFENTVPDGKREYQEHFMVGTFLADYHAFVPLAGATYDGDAQHVSWATSFALGGTFGSEVGEWDANGGTYVLGAFQPLVGAQYRHTYSEEWEAQTFLTIGAWKQEEFVPLVGVAYSSSAPFVQSLGSAQNTRDDQRSYLSAGVFVQGQYVPLVMVENNKDALAVGLLPPHY